VIYNCALVGCNKNNKRCIKIKKLSSKVVTFMLLVSVCVFSCFLHPSTFSGVPVSQNISSLYMKGGQYSGLETKLRRVRVTIVGVEKQ
jgi:hypothetical protein